MSSSYKIKLLANGFTKICSRAGLLSQTSPATVRLHSNRLIHTSRLLRTSPAFDTAKDRVTQLSEEPDNDVKLKLYALFKQASSGSCDKPKPGVMDFVGRAKWQAWADLKDMTKTDAEQQYIDLVNSLVTADGGNPATESDSQTQSGQKYETLLTENKENMFKITLNRPNKYNAITHQMYDELITALDEAANDSSVKFAVTTGAGDYYCSGNDLNNFAEALKGGKSVKEGAEEAGQLLNRFVKAFIDFPKPLIGAINGPAVGISVTVLGLYDAVYVSDKATFSTPFTSLGQSAEGCSSFMFPRLMGHSQACGMLLFNKKLTAQDAFQLGLATEVIPHDSFHSVINEKFKAIAQLPPQSLSISKTIIRDAIRPDLHAVNDRECNTLVERWQSQECMQALMAFSQRKSKA